MWGKLTGWLFGLDVQKSFDAISDKIDAGVYTEQEKAEQQQKVLDKRLEALGKQSIARRVLAIGITFHALMFLDVAVVLYLMHMVEEAEFVFKTLKEYLLQPWTAVIAFYLLVQFKK